MSDKIGLFTGSFDPITKGHLDLIARASELFDQLYVGIFYNPHKNGFLPIESRLETVEKAVAHLENVQVIASHDELVVDVAQYEASFDFYNHQLAGEIETVYLHSRPEHVYISSSAVRELLKFGQDISKYVPNAVLEELKNEEKN